MTKVLVFGTFDLLHPGHLFLLDEASQRGDLFVVIARDAHVEEIKGRAPEHNETERLQVVTDAFPDADVRLGDAKDFLVPVREINPDLILLGYDQRMPPGVSEEDLPCKTERLPAFEPEKWKSSLQRQQKNQ
jgi:FAD synthetase